MNVTDFPEPLERSGPRSGARFEYQHHVSAALLVKAVETEEECWALFDHIEDFVIATQNRTTYYQIKARNSGKWSAHNISEEDSNKKFPNSIVGKLLYFTNSSSVAFAVFLTNAEFGIKVEPDCSYPEGNVVVPVSKLDKASRDKIEINILKHKDFVPLDGFDRLSLWRFPCPPVEYGTYLLGVVAQSASDMGLQVDVNGVADALVSLVRQKATAEADESSSESLMETKGLTSTSVSDLFSEAASNYFDPNLFEMILQDLSAHGLPMHNRYAVGKALPSWMADRRLNATPFRAYEKRLTELAIAIPFGDDFVGDALAILAPHKPHLGDEDYNYTLAGLILQSWEAKNASSSSLSVGKDNSSQ